MHCSHVTFTLHMQNYYYFFKTEKNMNSFCAWLFVVCPSQHQMVKSLHSNYGHRILEETEESKQDRKSTNCMLKKGVVSCEVSLVRCTSQRCAPQVLPIPKLRAVFNCFHQFPSVCMFHVDKPMLMRWENGEKPSSNCVGVYNEFQ